MPRCSTGYGVLAAIAALLAGGCLRKDATHTVYVSPTDVTWSVIEGNVRSDETDPAKRSIEEQDYLLAARAGQHDVARAFAALGATGLSGLSGVTTVMLRQDRPFTVVTTARFTDLGQLARAMLARIGAKGGAAVERTGCERTFRAWIDVEHEPGGAADDIGALVAEPSAYRIVVTEGRLTRAEGFTIVEDGTIAVPSEVTPDDQGVARVSLTWVDGWCHDGR